MSTLATTAFRTDDDVEIPDADSPAFAAVRDTIGRHLLADGLPIVLDLDRSKGVRLVDGVSGRSYLDLFGFYASMPLGINPDAMVGDAEFLARLQQAAVNKVANSDVYTSHMARFVDTFSRVGIPAHLPHAFFVEGGALAVENALKVAFDYKVQKNYAKGHRREVGQQVLHFEHAFHGRSGYTMSLTNTDPRKVAGFPKFPWPRIESPAAHFGRGGVLDVAETEAREARALAQAKQAFYDAGDDIACIIVEPIQSEGGDRHLRPEFLAALRDLAHENDALLIFDEVQTGVAASGAFWCHEAMGVEPDVLAFGKKTQVCGILAGPKVDEVDSNVFHVSSRINSTWGGNLVDMVRFDRVLETIEADDLIGHSARIGTHLHSGLLALEAEHGDLVSQVRGRGTLCAFDLPTGGHRNRALDLAYENGLMLLGCGPLSVRFRPPLTITEAEVSEGLGVLDRVLGQLAAEDVDPTRKGRK